MTIYAIFYKVRVRGVIERVIQRDMLFTNQGTANYHVVLLNEPIHEEFGELNLRDGYYVVEELTVK